MKLEVLVTTMHQCDFEKYSEMNLQTDAVIANQTDHNDFSEMVFNGHNVKLVSTNSIGTSRNRNISMAFANSNSDYLMFSDDDLVFNHGYEQLIMEEFEKHPEAEAIKFSIHVLGENERACAQPIQRFEKATRRNMSAFGVCALVIRQDVLRNKNLHFHEGFGPGTQHYFGEDTIFLMDMIEKKVCVYRSPVDIAGFDLSTSSWFTGYDEQYFQNAGLLLKEIFPVLSLLLVIRSAYRARKRKLCTYSYWKILKCYYRGVFTSI